jgi:hypothetical protein
LTSKEKDTIIIAYVKQLTQFFKNII